MALKSIRKNSTKKLIQYINDSAIVAVFRDNGYHPIAASDAIAIIKRKSIKNCVVDQSDRLTFDITERNVGQYITTFMSIEAMRKSLYPKDVARLEPNNEMYQFAQSKLA